MRAPLRLAVIASLASLAGWSTVAQEAKDAKATPAAKEQAAEGKDFSVEGHYLEACSCRPPCPCELTGVMMGCKGVGAYQFDKGSYDGEDFSGTRIAYSLYIGEAVHIYIDAPDAKKRAAVEKFGRAFLKAFGPIKGVHESKVEIAGKDGSYTLKVDGGKTMACVTEPVLGGDKKTPIVHSNTHDVVNRTMYQGTCVSCTYAEGEMKITLEKGRNAYFNQGMKATGKV